MCKGLIFSCIAAVMLVTAAYGATTSREKVELLDVLIKDLGQLKASKDKIHLYTPNENQKCRRKTLQCYLEEVKILPNIIAEKNAATLPNIIKNLHELTELTPPEAECKACEANPKKRFPEFHQALLNFLRYMRK